MITARAVCNYRQEYQQGEIRLATLGFGPDYLDGANREWAHATPHLDLRMTVRGDVAQHFFPGKSYVLQFSEVEV